MTYNILLCLVYLSSTVTLIIATTSCDQGTNCHLPECFCSTLTHPMDATDIPQMVYFGIDGDVNTLSAEYYDFLFGDGRSNPNGCPLSVTLFISHNGTDYGAVKKYYNRGFDIGVSMDGRSGTNTGRNILQKVENQRSNIINLAGVPRNKVSGWRSSNGKAANVTTQKQLFHLGYIYDMSLSYTRGHASDDDLWPYTLDNGWSTNSTCLSLCPQQAINGVWEVPINSMLLDKVPCVYADGCYRRFTNFNESYRYLMDNFRSHYNGNRAPFGINLHSARFIENFPQEALYRAIQDMLHYGDVYIVNIRQVIEWMKHPTTLSEIDGFRPWGCTSDGKHQKRHASNAITEAEQALIDILILVASVGIIFVMHLIIRRCCQGSKYKQYFRIGNQPTRENVLM